MYRPNDSREQNMSNSKTVKECVQRDSECVVCGWPEFEVRETTAVPPETDSSIVGNQFDVCLNCGETYETPNND